MWRLSDRTDKQGYPCCFTAQPSIFTLQRLVHSPPTTNVFGSRLSGADLVTRADDMQVDLHFVASGIRRARFSNQADVLVRVYAGLDVSYCSQSVLAAHIEQSTKPSPFFFSLSFFSPPKQIKRLSAFSEFSFISS